MKDNERIVSILDRIRGVGIWTGELTMIRGIQKWDALPADDLGLRKTISRYYCGDIRIPSDETCGIAQRWGKWKGLAAYHLIVAESIETQGHRTLQSIIVKSVQPDSLVV